MEKQTKNLLGEKTKRKYFAAIIVLLLLGLGFVFTGLIATTESAMFAYWGFDEGRGTVVSEKINGESDSIQYVFTRTQFKPASEPLWRQQGIAGSALLFDGFSTYITSASNAFTQPVKEISVSAWVAPRFFEYGDGGKLSAIVNQHDKAANTGFVLGVYRHGSWSFQFGTGNAWVELWDKEWPLEKDQWTHLVATYNSQNGKAALYMNGEQIQEQQLPDSLIGAAIMPAETDLVVGRHNQHEVLASVFNLNMYNGLLDELKIYKQALTPEQVKESFEQYLAPHGQKIPAIKAEDIQLDSRKYAGDKHRPQFHAIPPAHWMNEPHAPIYYNGKYHLFYQHNPSGPYWHQIHWGHWISDDMVHWQSLPVALAPERDTLSPDGIWSGSATYDKNGVPVLFFTAANDAASPNQRVALARPADPTDPNLTNWVKHPVPLIVQKEGQGLFGDFRDPFVWQDSKDKKWYLLNGTGLPEAGGTALLYSSADMLNWEYHGPFYTFDTKKYPFLGPIWELPVFLPIGEYPSGEKKYIFLVSPVGNGADVEVYYWLGRFEKHKGRFVPDQEAPQKTDLGDFHFTGPSGMVDPKTGRVIIFTIAQGNRTSADEYHAGWAHNAGLPVQLSLNKDGRLLVKPIDELKSLRKKELVSIKKKSLAEANKLLAGLRGKMLEIVLEIKAKDALKYGIKLRRSPTGEEETLVYYDAKEKSLWADRTKTSLARKQGVEGGKLNLGKESLRLHIYLDHSMLETYANDYQSLTTRVYPSLDNAEGIQLWADKDVIIENLQVWELKSIYP